MTAPKKRTSKRVPNITIYLGKNPDRQQRIDALDRLAQRLGFDNRSQLIQAIADGEIKAIR